MQRFLLLLVSLWCSVLCFTVTRFSSQSQTSLHALISRRQVMGAAGWIATLPPPALAVDASGLLNSRLTENLINPPPYGMEASDIFYPSWFNGSWKVSSTTKEILAPCGISLFGTNSTYQKAQAEVGTTLNYESRFLSSPNNAVIADREYNVRTIAKAAMGANSVIDIPLAAPNKLTAILAPQGAPGLLKADLITLQRRQETIDATHFDCAEVVREIVAPVDSKPSTSVLLKEIETVSMYTYNPSTDTVSCQQRSAAFLLPSQNSPMAMNMYQASRGRAVDVRFYELTYTRR